ncbi:MAG: DUF1905 domain-containing protein [Alphaproteobacteria bacterium]|nr:DUF1905 domain-containing protein [Alphaproteobacteria bacterium]
MGTPSPALRFRARIAITGINPYVLVDARRASRLRKNWRKPMPVTVQVNGKPDAPWRINMMPRGDGSFFLYLAGIVRKASGTGVGDLVTVLVRFDGSYKGGPAHPMPSWFAAPLKQNRRARAGWEQLSPSRQKEILRYFAGLKSADAQARNLKRALHVLAGGRARFMARDWNSDKADSAPLKPRAAPPSRRSRRRPLSE